MRIADTTGEFGKVKKAPFGDSYKFTVRVRLKVQSVAGYNPYRERMKELQEGKNPVLSFSANEVPIQSYPVSSPVEENAEEALPQAEEALPQFVEEKYVSSKVAPLSGTVGSKVVIDSIMDRETIVANSHCIGEHYGGGIVFFVSDNGFDNGQHGLIAATEDQSTGIGWSAVNFWGGGVFTSATADGISAGQENTAKIIAKIGNGDGFSYAAKLCEEYSVTVNGVLYDDWYLPSKHELNLLYQQKNTIGVFADTSYWSSTEVDTVSVWYQNFGNGNQGYYWHIRDAPLRVRAIRAFY